MIRPDQVGWMQELGCAIKEQRKGACGYSQGALAQQVGIDQAALSLLEHGKQSMAIDKVRAILNTIGLDLAVVALN
jgi:transcriptional regulator with XRE-family HTH domain